MTLRHRASRFAIVACAVALVAVVLSIACMLFANSVAPRRAWRNPEPAYLLQIAPAVCAAGAFFVAFAAMAIAWVTGAEALTVTLRSLRSLGGALRDGSGGSHPDTLAHKLLRDGLRGQAWVYAARGALALSIPFGFVAMWAPTSEAPNKLGTLLSPESLEILQRAALGLPVLGALVLFGWLPLPWIATRDLLAALTRHGDVRRRLTDSGAAGGGGLQLEVQMRPRWEGRMRNVLALCMALGLAVPVGLVLFDLLGMRTLELRAFATLAGVFFLLACVGVTVFGDLCVTRILDALTQLAHQSVSLLNFVSSGRGGLAGRTTTLGVAFATSALSSLTMLFAGACVAVAVAIPLAYEGGPALASAAYCLLLAPVVLCYGMLLSAYGRVLDLALRHAREVWIEIDKRGDRGHSSQPGQARSAPPAPKRPATHRLRPPPGSVGAREER